MTIGQKMAELLNRRHYKGGKAGNGAGNGAVAPLPV